jgi:hypothetical protein
MKRYKILIAILSVIALSGCADYLDKQPLDKISSSTFWQTKSDFDMALTANYGYMHGSTSGPWDTPPAGMWGYVMPNWDNITDNSFGQHSYGGSKQIVSGDISSTTGGYVTGIYRFCYQAIARGNIFLNELSAYEGTDFPDADKKNAEAEVRFLRAFYYFQLYCFYGDVPLILEPLTLENQEQPKVDAAQILTQVITDLDFAIANLHTVPYYENAGHVTQSTAQALKARALIYAAYGDNGTPDHSMLTDVRDLCLDIMPHYALSPEFEDLFQDAGQSGNTEIIFSVNYLAPDNVPTYGTDLIYGDWLVVSPLQSFVDAFECSDGLPWGESPLTDTENPFENRDARLSKTVFVDFVDWGNGNVHYPSNSRPTGYGLKKFLDPGNLPYGYSTLSQQNTVVIRLAEVLLMYAEAQNEISGPDETVYNAMNAIRDRVDLPDLPEGLSKEEMRERIRQERRIELAFEGLRYIDLKRWHVAGEVLNSVTDGLLPYHWEDKFYHWPIPQDEIDKNHGTLVQNPDYQ